MNNRMVKKTTQQELIRRRQHFMGNAYRLFYDRPLHIVRGEGVWLYDSDGRKYLDVYNNVPHVGHCHPHVVEAISRQTRVLNTHTRYLHEGILEYSQRLTRKFPEGLDIAMFSCTGTEANELALRLARAKTGGTGMIVSEHAYHGNSWAIAQITTACETSEERGDNIVSVPSPDSYRGLYAGQDQAAEKYAAHVATAIDMLAQRGHRPAAFIVDTILSSDGLPTIPAGYLARAVEIVRDAGGLFVADEVQPGFGRMGSEFWGFATHNVVPDVVTMGKPMGNGYPVSAMVTSRGVIDEFTGHSHYFNTFGGNPVACAAAMAVLDVIEQENLQSNALEVGAYIRRGLRQLAGNHELIGDIRGSGLFIGVDLVLDRDTREPATDAANRIANLLSQRGILVGTEGPHDNVLKLRPPMVFSRHNADLLLQGIEDVLVLEPAS